MVEDGTVFPDLGCPARAGIGPNHGVTVAVARRLPRASGDRPVSDVKKGLTARVAPRERG